MHIVVTGDSNALPRPFNNKTFTFEEELSFYYRDTYGYLTYSWLRERCPDPLQAIYSNRAFKGSTIRDVYREIEQHLFLLQPSLLLVQVGLCDCWIRPALETDPKQYVPIEKFTDYYGKIIDLLKNRPKMKCIIIGICPPDPVMEERFPGVLHEIDRYNQVLKAGVDSEQIFFLDIAKRIEEVQPPNYLHADHQHLDKAGHYFLFQEIQKIVLEHRFDFT
ncbi:SGNH/GDSL hydrolase family protein [Cohnella hongkongensis]|uniref:SGNH/GDSL hydrolase family protein n=1 Tax=Cohnella hongkongensis TaxID=178337 RepID=A0ABV9FCH1_9BACL